MIIIFSSATPLGIVIGWIFSDQSKIVSGVFMAIACGSFFYKSTVEIIVEEFFVSNYKWIKFLSYSIGLSLVVGLWYTEY